MFVKFLQIVRRADERPLCFYVFQAVDGESSESEPLFDVCEDGLDDFASSLQLEPLASVFLFRELALCVFVPWREFYGAPPFVFCAFGGSLALGAVFAAVDSKRAVAGF